MGRSSHFSVALAVVAVALGVDFATGRDLSAFYAQLGNACWLGVVVSALVFGLWTALLARLGRRTGADTLAGVFRRLPGGPMGGGMTALYAVFLAVASGMTLAAAGHMGALALPLRSGGVCTAVLAALLAAWIVLGGEQSLCRAGGLFVGCVALMELGLMLFGRLPVRSGLNFELEMKLRNNWGAALLFALVHASMCACISAGAVARLSRGRLLPWRLGLWSGALFAVLLAGGNAALMVQEEKLLLLQLPFVALASGWGTAGFYLSAGLSYFAAVMTLAGLIYGLIPRHNPRKLGNYDVKF